MDIYQALAKGLGQEKEPNCLGEILETVAPLLPETTVAKIRQSFIDRKPPNVSSLEIQQINQKYWEWWQALPKPKYNTWRFELKHWLNAIGISSENLL